MEVDAYDVAVLGGAFSGACLAILLKRHRPGCRVLVIERRAAFDHKVGESVADVAACFLSRVVRVTQHLERKHIAKHGLRFWFTDGVNQDPFQCTEIGTYAQPKLGTFQVDRLVLDEYLLKQAAEEGCEVLRPAKLAEFSQQGDGNWELKIEQGGGVRTVRAKWLVDASGKAATLARKFQYWRKLETHPTDSCWCRFENVTEMDGAALAQRNGEWANAVRCSRGSATNHLMGRGWWSWIIPLGDGQVSLGLTHDRRIFSLEEQGDIAERLLAHAKRHPMGKLLFEHAQPLVGDARAYSQLAYYSERVAGDGWCCVGDAAGFMDPLYSHGLDYASYGICAALEVIEKKLDGGDVAMAIGAMNRRYRESYEAWFAALYEDKYYYMGDAQLMWAAFLLDIGMYFAGPVRLVHAKLEEEFALYPYAGAPGRIAASFMRCYNRRLVRLAKQRWERGTYGRANTGRRLFVKGGFATDSSIGKVISKGARAWWGAELGRTLSPSMEMRHASCANWSPSSAM